MELNQSSNMKVALHLHKKFISSILRQAPRSLSTHEPTRPSILFFILSGLDVLKCIDCLCQEEKSGICDWIYSQQVQPRPGLENDIEELKKCGFYGSRTLTFIGCDIRNNARYHAAHIAMTYSCLLSLIILGDELSRINKTAVLKAIKYLQNENGSFSSSVIDGENDIRFVYCAIVICYILKDFSYIDVDKTVQFIKDSIGFDGSIGLEPKCESHGGFSFCAIASLFLMGKLETAFSSNQMKKLQRWLILRQQSGFQGRPNKDVDTCYSFWIGAALKIVGLFTQVNWDENRKFILLCQNNRIGGISKDVNTKPDILHTYFGLCGLSFMNEPGLEELNPALNMSTRAYEHLKRIHETW